MNPRDECGRVLSEFEDGLDLYAPDGGPFGCRVLDYGEVSAVLTLEALPGRAFKRMSGFRSAEETAAYIDSVGRYIRVLGERGVKVLETECFSLAARSPVVYLAQPLVDPARIGNALLRTVPDEMLAGIMELVLDRIAASLRANLAAADGVEAAADSQLSNWYFPEKGTDPLLIDVGSAIFRIDGKIQAYCEPLYRSFIWPLGPVVRMMGAVEDYYEHYFDLRHAVLDILGNFTKERAAERIGKGLAIANRWLSLQPEKYYIQPFTADEVRKFYRSDAATLELMLRVRRATRFVRNRVTRKGYDYLLPGKITRR